MNTASAKRHEDRLIPISALQHFSYCPRQCALIHLEQAFEENVSTLRGRAVHRLVDEPEGETERGVRIERALPLKSEIEGLTGRADVVEFLPDGTPYPVEYKHGKRHSRLHDDIQLAAQALCLEAMTGKQVPEGAIYHHSSRRRREVKITDQLREQVRKTSAAVLAMFETGKLPPPTDDARLCRNCSLHELCQPGLLRQAATLHQLREQLFTAEGDG